MKKIILVMTILFFASQCFADEIVPAGQSFAEQIQKERAAVANALQLTDEQAKCYMDIARKNQTVLNEKYRALYDESVKLKTMKAEKASKNSINSQIKNINCIKKEIKDIILSENKQIKKILDHDQRAKLRMIQKLERNSMKECQKDYHKHNPKLRQFGGAGQRF